MREILFRAGTDAHDRHQRTVALIRADPLRVRHVVLSSTYVVPSQDVTRFAILQMVRDNVLSNVLTVCVRNSFCFGICTRSMFPKIKKKKKDLSH